MVTIPAWILVGIILGVAGVSGGVFWAVGRFLLEKSYDFFIEEEEEEEETVSPAPAPTSCKEDKEDGMATTAEIKKELDRAAQNLVKVTTALRSERTGRAEDNRKRDEVITAKDQEIAALKEQLQKLSSEKEAQGSAVAQGAASLISANEEAEKAMAGS
ncbi:MAG: hypothetical protein HYU04_00370 [Candidatus Wildermuthbacteria bacterium]|nr:hypothetical protein [Candidatus Wildermuthbacteria bacterium]